MYSQLSDAELERLAILAEECAEVIQVIGKILRHGYESDNHGKLPQTNRQHLEEEIGNVRCIIEKMVTANDLREWRIEVERLHKEATIGKYLHHQEGL
jgi:hypothetical protein